MALTPQQRVQLHQGAQEMLKWVASNYRGNNVAVSIAVAYATAMGTLNGVQMNPQQTRELAAVVNDMLGPLPQFAQMTPLQKQNEYDWLIFQSLIIRVLSEMGQRDPQARLQAIQLARVVLRQLNVSA